MKKMILALLLCVASLSYAATFMAVPTYNTVKIKESRTETVLHYDGDNTSAVGTNSAATFEVAIRLTATELTAVYGQAIKKVQFNITAGTYSQVTAKIYEGASATAPGTLLSSQILTVVPDALTTYDLESPVTLESGKEYWVGYEVVATGGYPAGVDAGPVAAAGKSNMIFFQGAWAELTALSATLTGNWNIRAVVDDTPIVDAAAPTVVSISGNSTTPTTPMNLELKISDYSDTPATLAGKYNIGAGDVDITLNKVVRKTRGSSKAQYTYTCTIPGQADGTNGTVKFNLVDNLNNQAWSNDFPISWATPVPYVINENFDAVTVPALPADWTVEDVNGDNKKWVTAAGGQSAPNSLKISWNSAMAMDDWVYTPGFYPVANTPYKVKFSYKAASATFPEIFEVKFGNTAAATGMTNDLVAPITVASTTYATDSVTFTPTTGDKIYIGFHGISAKDMYSLYLDDIKVIGAMPADTQFPEAAAPSGASANIGADMVLSTVVTDQTGIASVSGKYQLTGQNTWTDFPMTASKAVSGTYTGTITAQPTAITGKVKFLTTDTANPANSGESAEYDISWATQATPLFTDDFESYEDFTATFSPWTTVDVDGDSTYNINITSGGSYTYPGEQSPTAFRIFNPSSTAPVLDGAGYAAHSGNKYAISFDCRSTNGNPIKQTNDWMITPQMILGTNSSLTFYVKSIDSEYKDSYKVLVSTTDNQVGSFTAISGPTVAPDTEWTKVDLSLAAYDGQTVYVAIQNVSNDMWALIVDDFTIYSVGGTVDIGNQLVTTKTSTLSNNYPNPFNPTTTINFANKMDGNVKLTVMNAKGEHVATLVNSNMSAGSHTVNFDGSKLNSGVYFYKLETADATITHKMLLVK